MIVKESYSWIGCMLQLNTPKKGSPRCYLHFSRILIKKSCNLIEREAQQTTSNQKCQSQMPPFFYYIHANNLRHPLIPSIDIDGQRTLRSDFKDRYNWPHPTKICSLRYYFSLKIISLKKKSKMPIDSFQRY